MLLQDWASLVDESLVQRVAVLETALRGKGEADPIGRPLGDRCVQQPHWRSPYGFVSVWPARWPADPGDDQARALFFRYGPYGFDGNPWTELHYALVSTSVSVAAGDIAEFLAPASPDPWSHPANLRGLRTERDTFLIDLTHEFGHAVVAAHRDGLVERIVIEGVEPDGATVSVNIGGHTVRAMGCRPTQWWDAAVVAAAGLVAEMLHANRSASFAAGAGLFLADASYLSDLEGAIAGILGSREVAAIAFNARNRLLERAMAEARETLPPLIDYLEHEAERWKRAVIKDPVETLVIEWTPELRNALCGC